MRTVRNIYFKEGIFTSGHGSEIIYFTGHLHSFVNKMPLEYDRNKDLFIDCSKCSKKEFRQILKKIKL